MALPARYQARRSYYSHTMIFYFVHVFKKSIPVDRDDLHFITFKNVCTCRNYMSAVVERRKRPLSTVENDLLFVRSLRPTCSQSSLFLSSPARGTRSRFVQNYIFPKCVASSSFFLRVDTISTNKTTTEEEKDCWHGVLGFPIYLCLSTIVVVAFRFPIGKKQPQNNSNYLAD
jgi:hypothetical protein